MKGQNRSNPVKSCQMEVVQAIVEFWLSALMTSRGGGGHSGLNRYPLTDSALPNSHVERKR